MNKRWRSDKKITMAGKSVPPTSAGIDLFLHQQGLDTTAV
jgi:hypothetical protein